MEIITESETIQKHERFSMHDLEHRYISDCSPPLPHELLVLAKRSIATWLDQGKHIYLLNAKQITIEREALTMGTTIDIDHRTLAKLAEDHSMRETLVIGHPGGWCVEVELNGTRGRLVSSRGAPRLFGRIETLTTYLRRMGILRFSVLAEGFEPSPSRKRPDAAERLTKTHEAAEHDAWFRLQVEEALEEADSPDAEWIDDGDALERVRQRIADAGHQRGHDAR